MTDHYVAGLEATAREQRLVIGRLEEEVAHLDRIVGQQSARLEAQARALAAVRQACDPYLGWPFWVEGEDAFAVRVEDIDKALDGGVK